MRTTVTLDPDVVRLLKDEAHRRGESFKIALNEAVRKAFQEAPKTPRKRKPFVVKSHHMGLMPGIDYAKANKLADDMEIDAFVELSKRLEKKKSDPARHKSSYLRP
jgi:hypothetical protein